MHPFIRSVTHVALFASGMFGAAAGLKSLESMPFWSWTKNKLGAAVHQLDGCDTVFIGSSRVQFGVRPDVFDGRMAELGGSTKSFNMGMSGLRQYDHDNVIEWVLQHRPPSLKRMVIELHTWRQEGSRGKWFTDQEVESHTPKTALPRLNTILADSYDAKTKVVEATYSTLHSLGNALRVGQGTRILDSAIAEAEGTGVATRRPIRDAGWVDIGMSPDKELKRKHEEFVSNPEPYARQFALKTKHLAPAWLDGAFDAEFLLRQADRIRAQGIEPIYVVFPTLLYDHWGRGRVSEVRERVRILELDDPNLHPDLFQTAKFNDRSHLSAEGAADFSRILAEQLAPPRLTTASN